jgi:RimJ/RimL family protein N-acetyltransferase
MPWAHQAPQPVEATVELLRTFRGKFDLGQDFVYAMFSPDVAEVVGGTGLHPRVGEGAVEIGYWLRASRVGQGLASESSAALTRVAIEVCGIDRVEIRVDPANEPSLAIPRKLGFVEEGTLRRRLHGPDGTPLQRDAVVFALLREELAGTPVAAVRLDAFDAGGKQVLST